MNTQYYANHNGQQQPPQQQQGQGWSSSYSQQSNNMPAGGVFYNGFANGTPSNNGSSGYNNFADSGNGFNNKRYSGAESNQWGGAPAEYSESNLFHRTDSGINFDKYENIPVEVSGDSVPAAIEHFNEAGFGPAVMENVNRSGYSKPTPVQKHSIPTLLANRDLMSCAQTGSGKTAAFLLPIIQHILAGGPDMVKPPAFTNGRRTYYPCALVLSPTRELAIQIHKEATKFSYKSNIQTAILYGGRENYRDQVNRLRAGTHILIATPGRLIDIIEQGFIGLAGCRYLVLDEADRMLDMGFEPQIRKIVGQGMPPKTARTTAMFSATFPKEIQVLAKDFLKDNYIFLAVGRVGSTSENIEQRLLWVNEMEKRSNLMEILMNEHSENLVLVFVETKRGANELAYFLNRQQIRSVSIHGDLKQIERERNLELFRSGQCPILVATAVAARGLDIPNVRHVINYDLPGDSDEYVHRIGRTGRCGNLGIATSFFNDKNRGIGRDLKNLIVESNQEVPEWLHQVAAEGRIGGGQRGGNRRFGATDYRVGRGGGGSFGGNFSNYNSGGATGGFGSGPAYGGSFGGGAPRRPFTNGGFGAHSSLSSTSNSGGGGGFSGPRRGGFNSGMNRQGGGGGGFYSNPGQAPIDHWQAPQA
ncbi:RNA helicase [Caenorhabditis elegans]|uniref:RNA helicase n=1 Tax=Caenorhabditis elegans TaxID=6239 RepID=Q95XY1_CAEEL|nr:RNA helicase [Caenorhabditis elegans]CCD72827.1 RNA helicase [Caenorhabditis elegans]|eukprot:NP_491112.1 Vasa-and Belle-like Helicase [Caenorhabditis elegans]